MNISRNSGRERIDLILNYLPISYKNIYTSSVEIYGSRNSGPSFTLLGCHIFSLTHGKKKKKGIPKLCYLYHHRVMEKEGPRYAYIFYL